MAKLHSFLQLTRNSSFVDLMNQINKSLEEYKDKNITQVKSRTDNVLNIEIIQKQFSANNTDK